MQAIRGDVDSTGNRALAGRVLIPAENSVPESSRYTLFSGALLRHHRTTEIHNELPHDESTAFAADDKYPESDHAPVIAHSEVPGR